MMQRLRGWMAAPVFDDVDTQRNARLMNALLGIITLLLLLQTPLIVTGVMNPERAVPIMMLLMLHSLVIKRLINQRLVRWAARLLVGGWGFTGALVLMLFGGEPNVMGALLVVIVLMAGMLLGPRAASVLALWSIAFIWVVYALGENGLSLAVFDAFDALENSIIFTAILIAGTIFVVILIRDMESSWRQARLELIQRRSLQETQLRQTIELNLLHELRTILAREEDLDGIIRKLVDSVQQSFGYAQVGVYLLDAAHTQLEEIYEVGSPSKYPVIPLGAGITSRVVMNEKPELVRDVQSDPDFVGPAHIYAEICVPLYVRGGVVGVINLESEHDNLDGDDLGLILTIAEYVSLALDRAELVEKLREERNLLLSLIDAVPSGIYAKDLESRFTVVNQSVVKAFGLKQRADVLGKSDRDFSGEAYFEVTRREEKEVMETGRPLLEKEEESGNGETYMASLTSKVPLHDASGQVMGVVGTTSDITPRKLAEYETRELNEQLEERVTARTAELSEANRELEAFAYTVSHDLRAPLRAIDGFAAMAQDELHAAEQANFEAYLGSIRKSIRRMSDLIDGLLNFSRLNRTPLQRAHIDLDQLVEEVWRELIGLNRNRQIQFSCDRLGKYEGDLTLMRQVFTNLLSNALKFTRNTQQANIHVGCEECEGQMVCFVRDNGVGFDLKYRDKLFGVFERLHSGADYEGTGVGLAIAQRILKRHGGDIWAESAPGGGATFYFSLEQSVDKEAVA